MPELNEMQPSSAYDSTLHQQPSSQEQPTLRTRLPDLDSSQPGPIEIDTSLLYTPASGNSSSDVSHSGISISDASILILAAHAMTASWYVLALSSGHDAIHFREALYTWYLHCY